MKKQNQPRACLLAGGCIRTHKLLLRTYARPPQRSSVRRGRWNWDCRLRLRPQMPAVTAAEDLEGMNMIEVRQPIDLDNLQKFLQEASGPDGAQRFGGGRLQLKQFNNGASNPTYFIQTPANEQFVVRKKPPGKLLKGAHAVDREFRVQNALNGTGVPVPEVMAFCEDDSVLGSMFYVMKFIPGRILQDNRLPGFSPDERAALYADIARVMSTLHSVDYKSIGLDGYSRTVGNYAARQVSTWSRNIAAQDQTVIEAAADEGYTWKPDLVEELETYLTSTASSIVEPTTVCHGDFRLGNFILHESEPKILGVLDWELSALGHPLADLAWCTNPYTFPDIYDDDGSLPEGIPTEDEFVQLYATNRGWDRVEQTEWDFFRALNKFRMLGINHGVYARSVMGTAASSEVRKAGAGLHFSVVQGLQFARGTYETPYGGAKTVTAKI